MYTKLQGKFLTKKEAVFLRYPETAGKICGIRMSGTSSIKRLKAGRVECLVDFSKEQTAAAERKALERLSAQVEIAGFRKGKVPPEMAKEKIREDRLFEETVHHLLPEAFDALVKEHEIKPIIRPRVEAQSRDPLTIKIIFVEKPKVSVKEKKLNTEKKVRTVDEKDVQKMVDYMLDKHKETAEVERAAKEGDLITMDFHGEMDGKEVEGTRTKGHQVEIGSKTLIPGFEEHLKDLKKGESKSFTVTFPEKYHAEHLQGKPVMFHVAVTGVQSVKRPELNDAFAKEALQAESAEDFLKQIRTTMQGEEEQIERNRRERALFDSIVEATDVELAPELLDEEVKGLIEEFSGQLERQGMSLEQYITQTKVTPEKFMTDMKSQAEKRLKLRLGIEELVVSRKITISEEAEEAAVQEVVSRAPKGQESQIQESYRKGSNAREQLVWQQKVEQLISDLLKE